MGKYSNVRATELQNAVNTALKEINSHNLSGIKNSLNNKSILQSGINSKVSSTITSITGNSSNNGNLSNLKSKLNTLKSVSQYIVKYQKVEEEIRKLESKLASASTRSASSIRSQIASKKRNLSTYENQIDAMLSR